MLSAFKTSVFGLRRANKLPALRKFDVPVLPMSSLLQEDYVEVIRILEDADGCWL